MAIGFAVVPGISMGLDDLETAPGWIWIGYLGWFGIFFSYPIWSIWFGRVLLRGSGGNVVEPGQGAEADRRR